MMNADLWRPIDVTYSFECIANEADLCFKLCFVGQMLELASAARPKVLTGRLASRRRRFQYAINHGPCKVLSSLGDSNSKALLRGGKLNKNHQSVVMSHRAAAVCKPLGCHLYELANGEGSIIHSCYQIIRLVGWPNKQQDPKSS